MELSIRWRCAAVTASLAMSMSGLTLAAQPNGPAHSLEHYLSLASEPLPSFLLRDFRGWELLDAEHLLVHANQREAWLIRVRTPCPGLREAWRIEIGEPGTRIYVNSAVVRFDGGSCRIDTARKLDPRKARGAGTAPRDPA